MKEKLFLKRMLITTGIILAVFLVLQITTRLILSDDYRTRLTPPRPNTGYEVNDLEAVVSNPDIIDVKAINDRNGNAEITLNGEHPGRVTINTVDTATRERIDSTSYMVSATGLVMDLSNGNFSNYRYSQAYIAMLITALAVMLWVNFSRAHRELRYSYHSLFCSGLGIWAAISSVLLIWSFLTNRDMLSVYETLQKAPIAFIYITFPVLAVFALLLTVSNIGLIRREGFRFNNALGILLSVVMLGGGLVVFFIDQLYTSGSKRQMDIYNSIVNVYATVYVLMECFLIGAVICGKLAASHEPDHDKDYIVILGCRIRPNGTLYPLIQGRVDCAIDFYRDQLEETGKQAVFIPSGGKGRDEIRSEAEAMAEYLREHGIPESAILPETRSVNTRENMLFSKALIEARNPQARTAFATTNYHVLRSGIISRQVDFDPDGMGSPTKWYYWPNAYVREVVGMLLYKRRSLLLLMIPITAFFATIQFIF